MQADRRFQSLDGVRLRIAKQGDDVATHCAATILASTDKPSAAMEIVTDVILLSDEVDEEEKKGLSALFRRKVGGGDTSVAGAVAKLRGDRTLEAIQDDEEAQGVVKEAGMQLLSCGSKETQGNVCDKILQGQPEESQLRLVMSVANRLDKHLLVQLVQSVLKKADEDLKAQALEGHVPKGMQEELDALYDALEVKAAVSVEKAKEAAAELEVSVSAARKALKKARGGLMQPPFFPSCFSRR